jgi:hypothetical protein
MRLHLAPVILVSLVLLLPGGISPRKASADLGECGQPVTGGASPTASDALYVLRAAVGSVQCEAAVCDTDGSCAVTAGDALRLLWYVTGQPLELSCELCGVTSSTTSTTSTTTTTLEPATWNEVHAIFVASTCGDVGCHGNAGSAASLENVDNANSAFNQLLNNPVSCYGSYFDELVVPFDADASFLVAKLEGLHDCGGYMPLVGAPLTPADLAKVRSWIDSGARQR